MQKNQKVAVLLFATALLLGCRDQHQTTFHQGRSLVIAGHYDEAINELETFATSASDSKYASRAGLFLFKAHCGKGDYKAAKKWCNWTIEQHPNSLESKKCMYKLALLTLASGNIDASVVQLKQVSQSSDNPLSAEADALLAVIKLLKSNKPHAVNARGQEAPNVVYKNESHGGQE